MISVDRRKFLLGLLSSSASVVVVPVADWSKVETTTLSPKPNMAEAIMNMPYNGPLYTGYIGEYSGGVNFLNV